MVRAPNADRIVDQWLASRDAGGDRAGPGTAAGHTRALVVDGRRCIRTRWYTARGRRVLEYWRIDGLRHAWSGGQSHGRVHRPKGPRAADVHDVVLPPPPVVARRGRVRRRPVGAAYDDVGRRPGLIAAPGPRSDRLHPAPVIILRDHGRMERASRARVAAGLLLLAALGLLGVLSVRAVLPSAPPGVHSPADQFSAARALPTWSGSAGSSTPPVRPPRRMFATTSPAPWASWVWTRRSRRGSVRPPNSAASSGWRSPAMSSPGCPGTASTGTLILMAHYDSVQVSFGGNDDGAGVSTLLEVARALTSGARRPNDVVFLFTDAEEACLCGAESFVAEPAGGGPRGGAQLESRGSTGPSVMFETSSGNADLVGLYGSVAPDRWPPVWPSRCTGSCPTTPIFTPFLDAGRFTGLNSAYIDGSGVYHAPQDTPASMDMAGLQHEAPTRWRWPRPLAAADLAVLSVPASGDASYFPALGVLIRYPGWLVWPLALAALAAVG